MKEKITQTAGSLYVQLGVRNVTMDKIARELGISKKTIYQHFKNKQALVREATLTLQESISENIRRGQEQELYREELNPDFIARIYFRTNTNLKDQWVFSPLDYPPTFISNNFLKYHIRGIATKLGLTILNDILAIQNDEE